MDIQKLKNITELKPIGEGKCAKCYTDGQRVFKMIKKDSDSLYLYDMKVVKNLVGKKSDLCVFPNELIYDKNGEWLGYTMDYVKGEKLANRISNIPFEELIRASKVAQEQVKDVSKIGLMFVDSHADNYMWDDEKRAIKIIDTDFFEPKDPTFELEKENEDRLLRTMQSIVVSKLGFYGTREDEKLKAFYSVRDLRELRKKNEKYTDVSKYLEDLKLMFEKDMGRSFTSIGQIEEVLKEKEDREEDLYNIKEAEKHLTFKQRLVKNILSSPTLHDMAIIGAYAQREVKKMTPFIQMVVRKSEFRLPPAGHANSVSELHEAFVSNLKTYDPIKEPTKDRIDKTQRNKDKEQEK